MITLTRPVGRLLAALLLLNLASCSTTDTTLMRIGTNLWIGYEPLYLAADQQQWPAAELRLIEYPSATEVLRAFRNHTLEAASLTLDEVLLLRQSDIPVQVVLVHDISDGADVIVARPEIDSFKALRGRRIAVESGALGAFVLTRALSLYQMSIADVEVHHLPIDRHQASYLAGEVDAAVTFEPVRTKLLNAGAVERFSSREIPGEIVDVLVVHQAFIDEHPQQVRRLVNGWFEAIDHLQQKPEQAAAFMSQRLGVSSDEVHASFDGLRFPNRAENRRLLGDDGELYTTLRLLADVMRSESLVSDAISTTALLTDRAL